MAVHAEPLNVTRRPSIRQTVLPLCVGASPLPLIRPCYCLFMKSTLFIGDLSTIRSKRQNLTFYVCYICVSILAILLRKIMINCIGREFFFYKCVYTLILCDFCDWLSYQGCWSWLPTDLEGFQEPVDHPRVPQLLQHPTWHLRRLQGKSVPGKLLQNLIWLRLQKIDSGNVASYIPQLAK